MAICTWMLCYKLADTLMLLWCYGWGFQYELGTAGRTQEVHLDTYVTISRHPQWLMSGYGFFMQEFKNFILNSSVF